LREEEKEGKKKYEERGDDKFFLKRMAIADELELVSALSGNPLTVRMVPGDP
jgi:hypothetical protein